MGCESRTGPGIVKMHKLTRGGRGGEGRQGRREGEGEGGVGRRYIMVVAIAAGNSIIS